MKLYYISFIVFIAILNHRIDAMELEEIVVEPEKCPIPSLQILCIKAFVKGRTLSDKEAAAIKKITPLTLPDEIHQIIRAYKPIQTETIKEQMAIFNARATRKK